MSQKLNFDFELQIVRDGKFGVKNENGEWNGMMGEITTGVSEAARKRTQPFNIFE